MGKVKKTGQNNKKTVELEADRLMGKDKGSEKIKWKGRKDYKERKNDRIVSPEEKVRHMNNNILLYISLLWNICEYDKCKYFLIPISIQAS